MLLTDVNVLLHAHRSETPDERRHRAWLERVLAGPEVVGISELVLSAVVRIATNHRVYADPTPPSIALRFCRDLLDAPAALPIRPGPRHWDLFTELVETTRARGNDVPDAYLAALAIENGATWISNDRGFARFPHLRWQLPDLDPT